MAYQHSLLWLWSLERSCANIYLICFEKCRVWVVDYLRAFLPETGNIWNLIFSCLRLPTQKPRGCVWTTTAERKKLDRTLKAHKIGFLFHGCALRRPSFLMNSRGYQFFTPPAPGGVPNPFLSFVPGRPPPPPFHHHPYPANPYTPFGFPQMPIPQG